MLFPRPLLYTLLFFTCFVFFLPNGNSQVINYTEPDKEDAKDLSFEIIGKLNGQVYVYKNSRDVHSISIFDASMQLLQKEKLDYLPTRILNVDFVAYSDFYYLIYQYQRKNIVYCMAIKLDAEAKKIGGVIPMDSTILNSNSSDKIYTVVNSEDKQRIMIVKINRLEGKEHEVTTVLFDKQLNLLHKTILAMVMPDNHAFLSEFQVDNTGDMAFLKSFGSNQSDVINKLSIVTKAALSDSLSQYEIPLKGNFLDDVRLKIDNYNKHYLINALYSTKKRGNVDGFFCFQWDKLQQHELLNTFIGLGEDLRSEASVSGTAKTALNTFYLRNVVVKKDGGILLAAESYYSNTSGNDLFNRWDGGFGLGGGFGGGYYGSPFSRPFNSVTRYFAENVLMLSIDNQGKLLWSNVIHKTQQDDNTENYISYSTLNSGDRIHFLFNTQEKRQNILTDQSITPEGQITRSPTIRGLDKGYEFMPRNGKQTGLRQIVVPCMYRNYICFAKIDF